MANEVTVIEMIGLRNNTHVRPMPPLAKQTLSIGGTVSAAFNASTNLVFITSTTDCNLEFSTPSAAPTGTGMTFPIAAGVDYDFSVRGGTKVIVVA